MRHDNDMMVPDWITINNVDGSSLGGVGESIEFTRSSSNGDDWYYEENQDRIKPDIWITRDMNGHYSMLIIKVLTLVLVRGTAWSWLSK